ncbi:MAG: hypothetical protein HYZ49_08610 [Chloroflexi bacterium]|nr:hypothetical protein [Chloroflexota bacterium]
MTLLFKPIDVLDAAIVDFFDSFHRQNFFLYERHTPTPASVVYSLHYNHMGQVRLSKRDDVSTEFVIIAREKQEYDLMTPEQMAEKEGIFKDSPGKQYTTEEERQKVIAGWTSRIADHRNLADTYENAKADLVQTLKEKRLWVEQPTASGASVAWEHSGETIIDTPTSGSVTRLDNGRLIQSKEITLPLSSTEQQTATGTGENGQTNLQTLTLYLDTDEQGFENELRTFIDKYNDKYLPQDYVSRINVTSDPFAAIVPKPVVGKVWALMFLARVGKIDNPTMKMGLTLVEFHGHYVGGKYPLSVKAFLSSYHLTAFSYDPKPFVDAFFARCREIWKCTDEASATIEGNGGKVKPKSNTKSTQPKLKEWEFVRDNLKAKPRIAGCTEYQTMVDMYFDEHTTPDIAPKVHLQPGRVDNLFSEWRRNYRMPTRRNLKIMKRKT